MPMLLSLEEVLQPRNRDVLVLDRSGCYAARPIGFFGDNPIAALRTSS
jgi:hypothetical protein